MLKTGILNPALNSLLSRVRHTNTLVIADRGFPYWPGLETVDLSLVDDVPTVLQVLTAIRANFELGRVFVAVEFREQNAISTAERLEQACAGVQIIEEPHMDFKKRVPEAIGIVRTADTIRFANLILESA